MNLKQIWEGTIGTTNLKNTKNGKTLTFGVNTYMVYDDGSPVSAIHVFGGFSAEYWEILELKVPVTIDGEQFQISKESAKSFKESINKVKL